MKTFQEWLKERLREETALDTRKDLGDALSAPPSPIALPPTYSPDQIAGLLVRKDPATAAAISKRATSDPTTMKLLNLAQQKQAPQPMPIAAPPGIVR